MNFPSLLDRIPLAQNSPSEIQSEVDGFVGNAVSMASDGTMMASLFTAGLTGRWIRLGTFSSLERFLAGGVLRGVSQTLGLAGESAVFASLEGGSQGFPKAWAAAAINLASLKLLGAVVQGQNLLIQHLLTDAGMVAGHQIGYAFNLTDRPQGTLTQQLLRAEGMNWGLKGSLALLHGLSPQGTALERSWDLTLRSQDTDLFSWGFPSFFLFAWVGEGSESFSGKSLEPEGAKGPEIVKMSGKRGKEEGRRGRLHREPPRHRNGPMSSVMVSFIDPTKVLRIGRAPDNDIVISHPDVSDHHAEIDFRNYPNLFVRDLGSLSGTYVHHVRLSPGIEENLMRKKSVTYRNEVRVGPVRIPVDLPSKIENYSEVVLLKTISAGTERWALRHYSLLNPPKTKK